MKGKRRSRADICSNGNYHLIDDIGDDKSKYKKKLNVRKNLIIVM